MADRKRKRCPTGERPKRRTRDRRGAELARYKKEHAEALRRQKELEAETETLRQALAEAQYAYGVISNAASWKVTKPIRALLDLLKRIPLFAWIIEALKRWKNGNRSRTEKPSGGGNAALPAVYALPTKEELAHQRKTRFPQKVKFSIVVPLYNTPESFLREMIQSVRHQTYADWELCLADGSDGEHGGVGKLCRAFCWRDRRIRYRKLERNLGISGNTNAGLDMATGDFIALLDHDDILHPAALYETMEAICRKDADFVYTDEATFASPDVKKIVTPHFKPDFAIDNLRANNYICHFTSFKRELLEKAGTFREEFDGSQDHDLMLRLAKVAKTIVHIPKILYFWRSHPGSVAQDIGVKEYAVAAGKKAVGCSVRADGYEATVESSRAFPAIYRLRYKIEGTPKVSILIPSKNHDRDLKKCLNSIFERTTYPNYEIVIVDNGSREKTVLEYYRRLEQERANVQVCSLDIEFNFSRLCNFAADQCDGEYYLLLNNDTEVIAPEWIEEMLMYAQRSDVGAVGAMLYYWNDTIQHAGVVLGLGADRIAGHIFERVSRDSIGYMGRLCYAQNLSAVTAACMMVRASVYKEMGGFDETLAVAYNDVDFCLRLREKGYLIVWTPYAELYHYQSKTRGSDLDEDKRARFLEEAERFKARWKKQIEAGDPYYNPNLTLDRSDFSLR